MPRLVLLESLIGLYIEDYIGAFPTLRADRQGIRRGEPLDSWYRDHVGVDTTLQQKSNRAIHASGTQGIGSILEALVLSRRGSSHEVLTMHPGLHLSLGILAIGRCDGGLILGVYLLEAHRDLCACSYRGSDIPCEPIVIRPRLDEGL